MNMRVRRCRDDEDYGLHLSLISSIHKCPTWSIQKCPTGPIQECLTSLGWLVVVLSPHSVDLVDLCLNIRMALHVGLNNAGLVIPGGVLGSCLVILLLGLSI
jgi:hypothetical protein